MEVLTTRYAQLLKMHRPLPFMCEIFMQALSAPPAPSSQDESEDRASLYRDGMIKRFEFVYDLIWWYLRLVLKVRHGIEVASPRSVFQECYNQNILSREEANILLSMIYTRDELEDIYDEDLLDRIGRHIIDIYPRFVDIIEKIKP